MAFKFTKAKRADVHVILGLMGGTGSGKTWSALRLATGLAGGERFAVIDTEAGRARHYADYFDFDHGDLAPPFAPSAYLEAILAAEAAGYPVAVIDSFSHEHAGEGGILDMHEKEHQRLGGRDNTKFLAWVKPKMEHKRMVSRLLQLRMHLVLCFRAEPKIKMVKVVKKGREVNEPVDAGWQPICAKGLEFEMAASFMLCHEAPGWSTTERLDPANPCGYPMKLPEPLRKFLEGRHQLAEEHGKKIAEWAGGKKGGPTLSEKLDKLRAAADARGLDLAKLIEEVSGGDPTVRLEDLKAGELKELAGKIRVAKKPEPAGVLPLGEPTR